MANRINSFPLSDSAGGHPRRAETDMDLAAASAASASSGVQSIDWLFKKERMYLLAQFWQQVRSFPYCDFASDYSIDLPSGYDGAVKSHTVGMC